MLTAWGRSFNHSLSGVSRSTNITASEFDTANEFDAFRLMWADVEKRVSEVYHVRCAQSAGIHSHTCYNDALPER
jgi:hypothetical protein